MNKLVLCAAALASSLSACGSPAEPTDAGSDATASDAGPPDAAAPDANVDAGPVVAEVFAEVGSRSEGIALGHDEAGASVLYVGTARDRIVRVTADGTVSDFVSVDGPVGIAVRADGTLLVCANLPAAEGGAPGILSVTPAGVVSTLVAAGPGGARFGLTNFVLEAPDHSIVFTDSAGDALYRADADGANVALIAPISYANGLAFSPDGGTLYVASWDTTTVHALSFDAATGAYGTPTPAHEGVTNVDGLVTTSTGELALVTSAAGVLLVDPAQPSAAPRVLATSRDVAIPANGVFGDAAFGPTELYLSVLGRPTIWVVHTDVMAP